MLYCLNAVSLMYIIYMDYNCLLILGYWLYHFEICTSLYKQRDDWQSLVHHWLLIYAWLSRPPDHCPLITPFLWYRYLYYTNLQLMYRKYHLHNMITNWKVSNVNKGFRQTQCITLKRLTLAWQFLIFVHRVNRIDRVRIIERTILCLHLFKCRRQ